MAELHYFPLYAADWLAGEATTRMTPEQESGFFRLLLHSWLAKDFPCSIPSDDEALAELSRLRGRWKKIGEYVRAQFVPVEGRPDRLRNPRLWRIYEAQTEKHERRVTSGRSGGKAKASAKQRSSNATAMLQQSSSNPLAKGYQPESESESELQTATVAAAGRFCASVNKGLTEHQDPKKRQLIPRITPNLQSTKDAVSAILSAGVPDDFAERELFEAGRTHGSETPVTSLKYFSSRIIRLWEQQKAGQDAANLKTPAGSPVKQKQTDAARIWGGIKRTKILHAHNSDEWLAGVTQMQVADEIESVEWFRALWKSIDLNTLKTARSDQYAVQHIASVMPANLKVVA